MLEDLDPCGLFEDFGFFPLGIILCAGRVAYYQYTSAREDLAKRLKMVLSISECLISSFLWDGTRSGTRSRDSCHWGEGTIEIKWTYFVRRMDAVFFGFSEAIIFVKYNSSDIRSLTSIGGGEGCSYRSWYAVKGSHSCMRET